jgi:hypothetical protein
MPVEPNGRAALFRQRAAEYEEKAETARSEEMRRSWLILARDWRQMADREELKYHDGQLQKLTPETPSEKA